jgi:hypothetical protein
MNINFFKATVVTLALTVSSFANSSLITHEFNDGDSLAAWSADRTAPDGFEIINNELVMSLTGPAHPTSTFYDTHGMKLDIGQSNYVSIDVFIDSAWIDSERYGGVWTQSFNASDEITGWPIVEFNGISGVQAWDNGGWQAFTTNFITGEFNNFKLQVTSNGVEYSLNDTVFYTDTVVDTQYFGNVFLNAKYEGNDFSVRYDNLVYGTVNVPEPSTFAILALGLLGLASRKFNKQ